MAAAVKSLCLLFLGLVLGACQNVPDPVSGTAYLVRHAEKVTAGEAMQIADPKDPPLTEAGQARAVQLADLLQDKGIDAVWSSDYRRTRDTALPLATRLGLVVQLYDPSDPDSLVSALKARPQDSVLVVGHSNTIPNLAALLGMSPGEPIDEANEYDRLYRIDLVSGEGQVQRYGGAQ